MNKKFFTISILLFIFFVLNIINTTSVYAIETCDSEENKNIQNLEINKNLITGKICYEDVLKKAKSHSYDLQLADFEILIAKQGIRSARSEYFPKLIAMAGTEYTKNFRDYTNSTITTVGDSFINPYTRFQSLMGITLSYNLFDFGIRHDNLTLSKEDSEVKALITESQMQDLELTLVDTYSKLLMTQKQIELYKEILDIETKNLEMYERLYKAKEISKQELNDERVKVKNIEISILELKSLFENHLNWLSFYTGEKYNPQDVLITDIKRPDFNPMEFNDYTKTLIWRIQDKEIKKKELELKIAKKNYLPKVNVYSRYYIYGSDPSSYNQALGDIRPTNYTIGGNIVMPVFDGFKTSANVQKATLELKKQIIERDKAIAEFTTKLSIMRSNLLFLESQTDTCNDIVLELDEKEKSAERLVKKQLISPIEFNNIKVEKLKQTIEYIKNSSAVIATLKGIQTLSTY